jgi:hypothetical protein
VIQALDFRMSFSRAPVVTARDDLTAEHQDRSDSRVGARLPQAAARFHKSGPHESDVVTAGKHDLEILAWLLQRNHGVLQALQNRRVRQDYSTVFGLHGLIMRQ